MTIYVIEIWRRVMDGREYCSSRFFADIVTAKRALFLMGFRALDDLVYQKDDLRATLTERILE